MKTIKIILALVCINITYSQIGINTNTPQSTLDIHAINHLGTVSPTDGMLVPRVANLSVSGTENGQLVYLTSNSAPYSVGFHFWDGTTWIGFDGTGTGGTINDWSINGNSGTTNGTNFIGTTDAQNFDIRTNSILRHRFTQDGQLEFLNTQGSVIIGEGAGAAQVSSGGGTPNSRNVLIGYEGGQSFTSGRANVAIGQSAGSSNVSGNNNTYTGAVSGLNNEGNENAFLGTSTGAGDAGAAGFQNSVFGDSAGGDIEQGNENTFIGQDSGSSNRDTSQNTYIGALSGDAVSFGIGNILIGYDAGSTAFMGFTLQIETSNSGTPLIGGDFLNDRVGINRPTSFGSLNNTFEVGGTASKSTAGNWLANSDKRLKKNIKTISANDALEKLTTLRGVSYQWNDSNKANQRPSGIQYGFIAQELMTVFPENVTKDNKGYYQTAYGDYDAFYVQALKELKDKIRNKDIEINNIKAKNQSRIETNAKLKKEINALKEELKKIEQLIQG